MNNNPLGLRQNLCVSFSRVLFVHTIFYTFSNSYIFEIFNTDIIAIVIIVKLVVKGCCQAFCQDCLYCIT